MNYTGMSRTTRLRTIVKDRFEVKDLGYRMHGLFIPEAWNRYTAEDFNQELIAW